MKAYRNTAFTILLWVKIYNDIPSSSKFIKRTEHGVRPYLFKGVTKYTEKIQI